MEAPNVNPFERLSNDLLGKILSKRLWNPFDITARQVGRDRVWLGAVCKQFHDLVHAHASLDWVVEDSSSEGDLVQYMLTHGVSLKRVCLKWSSDIGCSFMTGLLWLISHVAGTLEELRLFIDLDIDDEWYGRDWGVVFMLLQTCKKLTSVEIILWKADPQTPDVALVLARPLKPFLSLRSLTLYGFNLQPELMATFSTAFPLLEDLEVHCTSGAGAEPGAESFPISLQKLFLWGNGVMGFDRLNPDKVAVPKSTDLLLSILTNRGLRDSVPLLKKLRHLTAQSPKVLELVVATLGGMHGLMEFLETGTQWLKEYSIELLTTMFHEEELCQLFTQPDRLESFILVLDFSSSATRGRIIDFLLNITRDCISNQDLLAKVAGVGRRLIEVVINEWETGVGQKAMVLLNELLEDPQLGVGRSIVTVGPEAIHELVVLLAHQGADVRAGAAIALGRLAAIDVDSRGCIVAVRGVFEALANVLNDAVVTVRDAAQETLLKLLEDVCFKDIELDVRQCGLKLVAALAVKPSPSAAMCMLHKLLASVESLPQELTEAPGWLEFLEVLVELLEHQDWEFRHKAAWSLFYLVRDSEVRYQLSTEFHPVVQRLVALQVGPDPCHLYTEDVEGAVMGVLAGLASERRTRKAIAANPQCLELVAAQLLSADAAVSENAAYLLELLASAVECRCWVVDVPAVFITLGALLEDGSSAVAAGILELLVLALEYQGSEKSAQYSCTKEPGCVRWMVTVLRTASLDGSIRVLRAVVLAFASAIPLDDLARNAILNDQAALETLVRLANLGRDVKTLRNGARDVLQSLGRDAKTGEPLDTGEAPDETVDDGQGANLMQPEPLVESDALELALAVGGGDRQWGSGDGESLLGEEAELLTLDGWREEGGEH